MAFNHAHNFNLGNATFISTTNNFNLQSLQALIDTGEIFRQARAVEATHTSSTASYAPKCNPATRQKIIADIVDWVVEDASPGTGDDAGPASILWFSGPAGGGKTCIMRAVVDCCEAAGFSALSYFFSARITELSSERPFIATIAHQLANLDPVLMSMIQYTIRARPTIFEESLDFQMAKLVVDPLKSQAFQSQTPPPRKIVIAIDGFDECRLERERQHLLRILLSLVTQLPQLIVLVIASRPELDIRTAFARRKLKELTKLLRLQDYDGAEDIRIFLCDEFEAIRTTHPLRNSIPEGWPIEAIIQILIDKSSGNFIFPATLIKYIQNPRRNPVHSLNDVLNLSKSSRISNPLAELDALYSLILHPPNTDIALTKRILHCLVGLTAVVGGGNMPPSFFDTFLGLPPDTTRTAFCDLHSLLSVPDSDSEGSCIRLHHKSLEDYLTSPERSLDMFQDPIETYTDILTTFITHLELWEDDPETNSQWVERSALYWDDTLVSCITDKPSPALRDLILKLDPRISLKYVYIHAPHEIYASIYRHRNTQLTLHSALCTETKCLRLCRLLTRIEECSPDIQECIETYSDWDPERLVAFECNIGLYEPLELSPDNGDPDSTFHDVEADEATDLL